MKCLFSRPAIMLLVPVLLLLSACIPESKYPLPAPADGKGDDRLIGRWVGVEEDEKGYAEISSIGGGLYLVRIVDKPDDNETRYEILTSVIRGRWYMSIRLVGHAEDTVPKTSSYMIASYDISSQGILSIRLMRSETLAEDIRIGRIAGEVTPGENSDDVVLTADSEALAAYIAAADQGGIFNGVSLDPLRRQ